VRISLTLIALISLLLITVPAFADEESDYIENEAAEWTEIAENNGYNVLGTYIAPITEEDVYYTADLDPGKYHFYSSGGLNVLDLDMFIYDPDGIELGSDTYGDKIPIVVIQLDERTSVQVQVQAWAFEEGFDTGDFCIVLAAEEEGYVHDFFGTEVWEVVEIDIPMDEPVHEGTDDDYYNEVAENTMYFTINEEDFGNEVIDTDVVYVEDNLYSLEITLAPGFYQTYAQVDTRCMDLDISVYNEDGDMIADDHWEDPYPLCEFAVTDRQEITIDFEVWTEDDEIIECYVAYMVSMMGGVDEDSRYEHMEGELEWMTEMADFSDEQVLEAFIGEIDTDTMIQSYLYELDAGYYWVEAMGGLALKDIDMAAYNSFGELLDEDTYEDDYPMVFIELDEPDTVKVEVTLYSTMEGFDGGYFVFILSETQEFLGDEDYAYGDYSEWSGDEYELMDNAEWLSDSWYNIIDLHGEEIIDSFTVPIYADDDYIWIEEFPLDQGVYYLYVQGDDICLMDTDMTVYDDDNDVVAEDVLANNSPVCRIEVPRGGGIVEVEILAYWLDCDVGYFHLILAKE